MAGPGWELEGLSPVAELVDDLELGVPPFRRAAARSSALDLVADPLGGDLVSREEDGPGRVRAGPAAISPSAESTPLARGQTSA